MNGTHDDLQAILYAAYMDQVECYATALRLAGELSAMCSRGEVIDDRLNQVLAVLGDIAKKDALLAPMKRRWELAGKPSDEALRAAMNRIAELIQQLCWEWQSIERAVQARRDQLAHDLDVCNHQYRMQHAYQRES